VVAVPGSIATQNVASAASFASPSRPIASSCTRVHVAKPNDSWTRIAARFDVPLKRLLSINDATVNTAIFIGDRLCLKAAAVPSTPQPEATTPPDSSAPPAPSTPPDPSTPLVNYTRKQSTAIIREVWPDELEETALIVARRESNLVHRVIGGKNDCCVGLFQIYYSVHRSWLAEMGIVEPAQLLDPRVNAEAALRLYRRNGNSWRPWWTSSWRP
jgi:LysM repeat protein